MNRLPRSARPPAGGRVFPARRGRVLRRAGACVAAAVAAMTLAACDGGAIAQSTEQSNGQSFVSGSGTTYFPPGSRPRAPAVSGKTLTGQALALAAYHGDVVVMNFWGSWCAPCRQEAPSLAALARYFQPAGVRFVGVDIQDSPSAAEAFMRTFRIGYPSLSDPSDEIALDFHGTLPPTGIPSTLLIDRSGDIAARVVGATSYAGLKRLITKVDGHAPGSRTASGGTR